MTLSLLAVTGLTLATIGGQQALDRLETDAERSVSALPPVLITEVMYSPTSGPEWVELYNDSASSVSLDGLLLTDNEGTDLNEGELWFSSAQVIAPFDFLVVGAVAGGSVDMAWTGSLVLANTTDEVYLVSDPEKDGKFTTADVVDGVKYQSSWGGKGNGKSLSRTCLDCDPMLASSWTSSVAAGGTPGADNDTLPAESTPTPTPPPLPASGKKVLFDQAHCQTCGDADWIITGGYSSLAQALTAKGFTVASTQSRLSATVLAGYDVLVIPEPNTPFYATEQAAMIDFLKAGKGIWMIANHYGADRNNDGWDAVEVFNGYKSGGRTTSNDWLATNLRFRFKESGLSQDPVTDVRSTAITSGVTKVGLYSGTTMEILDSTKVQGAIYLSNTSYGPMAGLTSPAIGGRVVAQGDSSMYDDGTCSCSDALHANFSLYSHQTFAVNAALWLAKVL